LVTEDKDFGELVYRQGSVHVGVMLVRLHGLSSATKAHMVSATFMQHETEMPHSFTVISPGMVRIRHALM
jgi:predicted nuclease of predicted toxin-antitoxin system